MTLRPFGPSVALTTSARNSAPRHMASRAFPLNLTFLALTDVAPNRRAIFFVAARWPRRENSKPLISRNADRAALGIGERPATLRKRTLRQAAPDQVTWRVAPSMRDLCRDTLIGGPNTSSYTSQPNKLQ